MEDRLNTVATGTLASSISLQQLVNNLISNSLSCAIRNRSTVVNEIDKGIVIGATEPKIPEVLEELIATVVANSCNGEIHITADVYRDVMTVQIQERNNFNGYALSFSVNSIEAEATSLGGHISINGPQKKITTISFSFPNQFAA